VTPGVHDDSQVAPLGERTGGCSPRMAGLASTMQKHERNSGALAHEINSETHSTESGYSGHPEEYPLVTAVTNQSKDR
jgi:hypothetical protein